MDNITNIFLYFIIYSFLGWVCEVIYCGIPAKKFINRGFLNGPICPVYGVGSLLVINFLLKFQNNIISLFLLGGFVTSVLEYLTGYILETLFQTKWWDYSKNKFNINGRVCLLNSTLFACLSVILMKVVHPYIRKLLSYLSPNIINILSYILFVILIIDLLITIRSLVGLQGKLKQLKDIKLEFSSMNIHPKSFNKEELTRKFNMAYRKSTNNSHKDKFKELTDKLHLIKIRSTFENRLLKAFPNMNHKKYPEQLSHLKTLLEEQIAQRKELKKNK